MNPDPDQNENNQLKELALLLDVTESRHPNRDNHNVTEAAMAVGFDSLSRFNITFLPFTGASPKNTGRAKPDGTLIQYRGFTL
jgi:AraC-like DNA-binding protein